MLRMKTETGTHLIACIKSIILNRRALLATVLLISEGLLAAEAARRCQQHYDNAEYALAVSVCQQAATAGDAASQTVLGEMYDSGQAVEEDAAMAAKWWHAAAEKGYLRAQNLLASKYYYGGDVFGSQPGWEQDYRKAFELWQQGAHQGVPASQFMVGVLYMDGHGVDQNYPEAYAWFNLALQGGYQMANDTLTELSRMMSPRQKKQGEARLARMLHEGFGF